MSCKLHFLYWSEYSNFAVASSGFILVIKYFPQNWFRQLFSAFDSLVYAPHLKKLPIDCQHTCCLKRHQRCKGMFILWIILKIYIRYPTMIFLTSFLFYNRWICFRLFRFNGIQFSFRFGYHIWKISKFSITLSKM
jgi:hypothetical protein